MQQNQLTLPLNMKLCALLLRALLPIYPVSGTLFFHFCKWLNNALMQLDSSADRQQSAKYLPLQREREREKQEQRQTDHVNTYDAFHPLSLSLFLIQKKLQNDLLSVTYHAHSCLC